MGEDKKKLLQVVGGGLIIACAFAIMLPGFVAYLFGLWRIFALIAMIIIVTVTLVFAYHKLFKKSDSTGQETKVAEEPEQQ